VIIGIGRFGPYVRHNNKFVSLPKDADPLEIQLDEAISLIEAKEKKDSEKIIRTFEEEPDLQVLNGRYGPYISFNKSNYKIPKTMQPAELSLDDCRQLIAEADKNNEGKPAKKNGKATAKKSSTKKSSTKRSSTKKSTAKKTTAKKSTSKKTTTGTASARKTPAKKIKE